MTLWKTLVSSLSGDDASQRGADGRTLKPGDFRAPQRLKEGYIWCESMIMPRPCTIRDMSPLTAQIVLWQDDIKPHLLSRPLKLFSSADRKEADCVVAGRDGNVLNLRLSSAFRAPTRKYP
jgi:hypothetical protein